MSSPVKTMPSYVDYRDAYMQMNEEGIRHIAVINEKEDLVGILSESSFLDHLTPEQLLAVKEVSKVMSKTVVTCKPNDTLHLALEQMVSRKIGGIVVEENKKAVGIISERDALKFIQESKDLLDQPVSACMSSPVSTIHKKQTVLNAQTRMENLGIRRLVVVDDDENITGIVSYHDLFMNLPECYVGMFQESETEVQKTKKLLEKTTANLKRAQKVAQIGNWSYNVDDATVEWSDEMYTIYGRPFETSMTFELFYSWIHPDDRALHDSYMSKMLEMSPGQSLDTLSYRVVYEDGSIHWIKVTLEAEYNKEGKPRYFFGTAQDITKQHDAESKLQEAHSLLKKLSDIIPAMIYQFRRNPDGSFCFPYVSVGVKDIYELTPEKSCKLNMLNKLRW